MIERGITICAAYCTVLLQIGVLGVWPIIGGQPHLIALGSAVFLMLHRPVTGLWWLIPGAACIDLLLPSRFGITLIPLFLGYVGVSVLLRWAIEGAAWWHTVLVGIVLVAVSELPLTILTAEWLQLALDLGASMLILLPLGIAIARLLGPVRTGLRIGS